MFAVFVGICVIAYLVGGVFAIGLGSRYGLFEYQCRQPDHTLFEVVMWPFVLVVALLALTNAAVKKAINIIATPADERNR